MSSDIADRFGFIFPGSTSEISAAIRGNRYFNCGAHSTEKQSTYVAFNDYFWGRK